MKLEQQVVSPELAEKIKNLGITKESIFCYVCDPILGTQILPTANQGENFDFAAYTVAELGEMLPLGTQIWKYLDEKQQCKWAGRTPKTDETFGAYDTEADGKARMLIYLIENNLLSGLVSSEV